MGARRPVSGIGPTRWDKLSGRFQIYRDERAPIGLDASIYETTFDRDLVFVNVDNSDVGTVAERVGEGCGVRSGAVGSDASNYAARRG